MLTECCVVLIWVAVVAGDVVQILTMTMTLLRRCRVNAALTIQLFSQLFHFINMWLFNYVILQPKLQLCSRAWGVRFHQRLAQVQAWAEQQGLELAADCHLARVVQVCVQYHLCHSVIVRKVAEAELKLYRDWDSNHFYYVHSVWTSPCFDQSLYVFIISNKWTKSDWHRYWVTLTFDLAFRWAKP